MQFIKSNMETKLNIAEILKDKPKGTKLYADAFGELSIRDIDIESEPSIILLDKSGYILYFYSNGKYSLYGEPILFPSNAMQNWSKFAWKKGDVLSNSCGFQCIFKEWASDDYTKFNGCYSNSRDGYEDISNAETAKFYKLDNNTAYGYVRKIEKRFGGINMPQQTNIHNFHDLGLDSLIEALQNNGYQQTDFDAAMRNFYNKESFDADIPRILNRKERRKLEAINKKKGNKL